MWRAGWKLARKDHEVAEKRAEIDADQGRALSGSSFGSFFSAIMISEEPLQSMRGDRNLLRARAVTQSSKRPHRRSSTASCSCRGLPTRRIRLVRKTIDWHGYAEKMKLPILLLGAKPTNSVHSNTPRLSQRRSGDRNSLSSTPMRAIASAAPPPRPTVLTSEAIRRNGCKRALPASHYERVLVR